MDLDFDEVQSSLIARLEDFVANRLGDDKPDDPYELTVIKGLFDEGMLLVGTDRQHGLLEAALLTEKIARANRLAPVGLHSCLVAFLPEVSPISPVAICLERGRGPIRNAAEAETLIVVGPEFAKAYDCAPDQARRVAANYVYPLGCRPEVRGDGFDEWSAGFVRRRWQIAIGAEIVGALDGGMDHLVGYLSNRIQFGAKLTDKQAIRHRLAELAVNAEMTRCLVREAAWQDTSDKAATACCFAAKAAHTFCLEAHQLAGARGFSQEFGLYRWTLRLEFLSREAGGARLHGDVAATALWKPAKRAIELRENLRELKYS